MGNAAVDVLLALGVAAELVCCVGVLAMSGPFDRLHYAAAGTSVGPFLILGAVLVREGVTSGGLETIAAVSILFLLNPTLVVATSRAARWLESGSLEPTAAERRRGAS
jgi:multisubunit Na+/H+ antiporter MnhG subunit